MIAGGELRISLQDALRYAMARNLEILSGAYDPLIANEAVTAADGLFDTLLTAGFEASRIETPSNIVFQTSDVTRDETVTGYVGASRRMRNGGHLAVLFRADRIFTNSDIASSNPTTGGTAELEYVQPLLRGAGYVATADVRRARNGARSADYTQRALVDDVLLRTEIAYWNLVFARGNTEARRKSEQVARELLDQTKIRFDAKVATVLDLADARAGHESRRGDRIGSEGLEGQLEDALRALIFPFEGARNLRLRILPTDDPRALPGSEKPDAGQEERYVSQAVRARPELLAAHADLENRDIDIETARDELKPQLDLVGRLSTSGLEGAGWNAFEDTLTGEATGAAVGIAFSVYLGRRTAWANVRSADWSRRQTALRLRELENRVVQEVRFALRELSTARSRGVAAAEELSAAREALDGEQLKERNGESTPFRVLEKEDLVTQAAVREDRSAADVRIATARLWRAIGLLADARGLR
ncbi:MAG TPA: TolC family protein [Planctomycetota bacterium]|nr:TolC family protein [Planctomycetota bacterium]